MIKQGEEMHEGSKPNLVICKDAGWGDVKQALKNHEKGYFDVIHLDVPAQLVDSLG
jgi:hypothetical protein